MLQKKKWQNCMNDLRNPLHNFEKLFIFFTFLELKLVG